MEFQPAMGDMDHGLDSYAQFLERLIDGELPSDAEWLDHLDVLDAVRVSVVGRLERSKEYFPKAMNGYTSPGVKRDSEDEVQGLAALKELGVDLPLVLVEHELRSGFRRIAVSADHHVVTVLKNAGCSSNVTRKAEAVAGKYFGLGQVHIELVPAFMAAMRQRPMLRDLMSWWDRIPYGVSLTVVGRVLARANAQRSRASALLSFGSG